MLESKAIKLLLISVHKVQPILICFLTVAFYTSERKPPQPLELENVNYFSLLDRLVGIFLKLLWQYCNPPT